ncbi:MAG TPA: sigma factor-like helix-turn-helix DNA-binding protein, partial [Actinomycetota bacterium]|nr:sigma factor-like helix-turn-helix DNA-binding protein [Actinomycetota bacterium]
LDMLRSRESRREEPIGDSVPTTAGAVDPEHEAMLGDSIGLAMLVVLQTLTPGERVAFVLHDMFGVSFDEISTIVGRSPAATRQLASRARRRVQGADPMPEADSARKRQIVEAFLAAARGGDFAGLLALLDPEVVLRADAAAVKTGATDEVRGAAAVAETFSGRARVARTALVNGSPGAVWAVGGKPRVVFAFSIEDGRIVEIELLADERSIGELDLEILER